MDVISNQIFDFETNNNHIYFNLKENTYQVSVEFYGDCKIPIIFILNEEYNEPSVLKLNDHLLVINADYFGISQFN